jgi:hypothetical protein
MKKKMLLMVSDVVFVLIVCAMGLALVRQNQLGKHTIRNFVAGHQVGSFETTNPVYVTFAWHYGLTNGVVVQEPLRVTNYYWRVWSIFK